MNKEEEIKEQEQDQNNSIDGEILDEKDELISQLQKTVSDFNDKFFRLQADFENTKKRFEREKISDRDYANEKFAKELLPILDALEGASLIDVSQNEFATNIQDGILNCLAMLKGVLEKFGVKEIPTDISFDPNFHNAMNYIEDESKNSGDIANVYQKGYMYKERVLRASMVVIVKNKI